MKLSCIFLSCILLFAGVFAVYPISANAAESNIEQTLVYSVYGTGDTAYQAYKEKFKELSLPNQKVNIDILNFLSSEEHAKIITQNELGACVETNENGFIEWTFTVLESGLYNIAIYYYPVAGKGNTIIRSLKLDGEVPFDEAGNISFSRCFTDDGKISIDQYGNQIRPSQIESPRWMWKDLSDLQGYFNDPFLFYFSAGSHTLRLEAIREPILIGAIKLYQRDNVPTYGETIQTYEKMNYMSTAKQEIPIQGENALYKSVKTIYPITDLSSPATQPSSYSKTLLNTIGAEKWQNSGEWIEWEFNVVESGYYNLGFKARQNINAGRPSYRKIYINDEIPFSEMEAVMFPYSSKWNFYMIGGNDSPNLIYLDAGRHTIRMEVILGDLAPLIRQVNESMVKLNQIYLKFLMVIGPSPDINRDYAFQELFSEEIKELREQSIVLLNVYNEFIKLNGMNSSQSQQLKNIAKLIQKMCDNPNRIARLFNDFVNGMSSLGTWITTVMQQPLEIDYFMFLSPDMERPKVNANIFSSIMFSIQRFFATFYNDYITSTENKKEIKVWMSSGRDQANALNRLILNDFTPKDGTDVTLELVAGSALLSATMANKGPDVALNCEQSQPINYAIRGAVANLTQFPDYKEISNRFMKSAMLPLTFNNEVYGLPERQDFPLLFYRKDILNQLNLKVPKTWTEVIAMLPVLQKKNLNFGLPQPYIATSTGAGLSVYAMFLYQLGGTFYDEDGAVTMLENDEAINAFSKWTEFYNSYSLPTSYDFISRFRTGEIPIGIVSYSTYNVLSVFAPELNGIWEFALVPGTKQADGTVLKTVASSITASIIMESAKDKKACWEFMKWWTSKETQEKYGNEIESILGTSGRYQTANIEALYNIPWSAKDASILFEQWGYTQGIPEVPGSYMTSRLIDFAFKDAYRVTAGSNTDPIEALITAAKQINTELSEKRKEFGLVN